MPQSCPSRISDCESQYAANAHVQKGAATTKEDWLLALHFEYEVQSASRDAISGTVSKSNLQTASISQLTMDGLYQSLDPSKRQVRLLRMEIDEQESNDAVLPTNFLPFQLTVFPMDDMPKYKALSYCWGTEDASKTIEINRRTFHIRPNLYAFLEAQHIGDHSEIHSRGPWLFVDAVCINQQDLDERSSQVALMGDIYRGATEVIAWLGVDGDVERDFTETTLTRRGFHYDLGAWQHMFDDIACTRAFHAARRLFNDSEDDVDEFELLDFDAMFVQSLVIPLVCRPFWSRLWIVQEVILGKTLTIWYKTLRVSWDVLYACLEFGWSIALRNLGNSGGFQLFGLNHANLDYGSDRSALHVSFILKEKQRVSSNAQVGRIPLSTAIMSFNRQECSNPVDKVFGVLGMTPSVLEPNYSRRLFEVYCWALVEGILEILYEHPDGKGAALEITKFVVHLVRAVGQDLYDDEYMIETRAVLKHFGLPFKHVSELWAQTHHLNLASFRKFGWAGLKAYRTIPKLLHYQATWYENLEEGFYRLRGATNPDDKALDDEIRCMFDRILLKRCFDRWRFNALVHAILNLPLRPAEKAEELVGTIVSFPNRDQAVQLSEQAMKHIQEEITKSESSRDPITQDHVRRLESYMAILKGHIMSVRSARPVEPTSSKTSTRSPRQAQDLDTLLQFCSDPNFTGKLKWMFGDDNIKISAVEKIIFQALLKVWVDDQVQDLVKTRLSDKDFCDFLTRAGFVVPFSSEDDLNGVGDLIAA